MIHPILIPNVWSKKQCDAWITKTETLGYSDAAVETPAGLVKATHIRKNQKREDIDTELVRESLLHWQKHLDTVNSTIVLKNLFHIWRTYRYREGDRFIRHRDGKKTIGNDVSAMTALLYLNDNFVGGETVFYPESDSVGDPIVIVPATGALVLFEHNVWHSSTPVVTGVKYVLRTDVFL